MHSSIVLKGIKLSSHCGVTESERKQRQPLLVDLIFQCPNQSAFQSDQLIDTVDYAAITQCIKTSGESRPFALLESLANHLCETLFLQFPITRLKIWVRKTQPPMMDLQGSVGIRLTRTRPQPYRLSPDGPAPFLVDQHFRLPKGKILDIAMGKGRNSLFLASQGRHVHGIDKDEEGIRYSLNRAQQNGLSTLTTERLDLEPDSLALPDLGKALYDGVIVFFYLYRPLIPHLLRALKPGGVVIYETFILENHHKRHHPRRKEFCLAPNELLSLLQGVTILHYDEGDHHGWSDGTRAFTARLVAKKSPHE